MFTALNNDRSNSKLVTTVSATEARGRITAIEADRLSITESRVINEPLGTTVAVPGNK